MRKLRHASVLFGNGGNRDKSDAVSVRLGGNIPAVPLTHVAVKAVDNNDIQLHLILCNDRQPDRFFR